MNIQNTLTILYTFIILSLLLLIFVNAGIFGKMVALIVGTAYLMDSEYYEGGDADSDTPRLFESKSLTKSAVGLAYTQAGVDESLVLVDIDGTQVTVGDALRHCSGFSNDTWDYFKFVAADDAYQLSVDALAKAQRVEGFEYNDSMYQILATRFEELTLRKIDDVLKELIGDAPFTWDRDAHGSPLGPNGLRLSHEAAQRMGEAARLLMPRKPRVLVPKDHSILTHHPDIRFYVNGWWETFNHDLIGIGYRHYYIVAEGDGGVFVQLYNDDYRSEPTTEQKNFAKNATNHD
jgi:CubicO group peptidase (beta-lactamase class C family)